MPFRVTASYDVCFCPQISTLFVALCVSSCRESGHQAALVHLGW